MKILICVAYSVFIVFSSIGFILEVLSFFGVIDAKPRGFATGYFVNFILVLDRLKGVLNHGKPY